MLTIQVPIRKAGLRAGLALCASCVLLCPAGAVAQESAAAATVEELDSLLREAAENNAEIRAAEQRVVAAEAVIPQARTLPDPMLMLSYEDMAVRETMYGLSQEIPFPGKLRLKGEVAAREAESMAEEYAGVRLAVMARLKEAYYELLLARRSISIIEKTRQLLVEIAAAAEAGYAVGRMAQADVFRAQAEISRSHARLATARQQQASAAAELARLLGRPAEAPIAANGELRPMPLHRSLAETVALVEQAPTLRSRAKIVERSNAALDLARREYLPDFQVGLQGVHEEPMGDDGYQVMLNVSVPLYFASKQRHGVREALASRNEANGDLQAMRQDLVKRVREEIAQIERAEKLIDLLGDTIVPQAQLTLASARSGYAVGRVDFLTLLSSLFALQENELELQAEIAAHEKARARLEEIIGEQP